MKADSLGDNDQIPTVTPQESTWMRITVKPSTIGEIEERRSKAGIDSDALLTESELEQIGSAINTMKNSYGVRTFGPDPTTTPGEPTNPHTKKLGSGTRINPVRRNAALTKSAGARIGTSSEKMILRQ